MEVGQRARVHVPHPLRPYEPLFVNAALTGMVPTRAQVPDVPVTPEQIVQDAVACADAGAAIAGRRLATPPEVREHLGLAL